MRVTAYIPCFNAERYVAATIQGLLAQTHPPDELVIIDDGSTDHSVEIASGFPVRVVRHERNKGLAAARNTAFRNARFPLVAALDADAVPTRHWLEHLYHNLEDNKVAGAGGRLIEKFRDAPADCWRFLHLPQDPGTERLEITWPSQRRLGGFATLMRKSAVEQVGGYDERYRTNYEDHDISLKLMSAGHTLVMEPNAIAYHMRRDTVRSVLRSDWQWQFWGLYFKGHYQTIMRKVGSNFPAAMRMAWQHWKDGYKLSLLPVDAAYPFLHSYWDLRYHFSSARLAGPPKVTE